MIRIPKYQSIVPGLRRAVDSLTPREKETSVVEWGRFYAKVGVLRKNKYNYLVKRADVVALDYPELNKSTPLFDLLATEGYRRASRSILVVPPEYLSIRNVSLPAIEENDIGRMVLLQAQIHTPFPEGDFVCGYSVANKYETGVRDVILYSARKSFVREQIDLLAEHGKTVMEVVPSVDLIRQYIYSSEELGALLQNQSVAVINIDFGGACILIFSDGTLLGIRSVASGPENGGLLSKAGDRCRWQGVVADEVEATVDFCRTKVDDFNLDKTIITGAMTLVAPLSATFERTGSAPVVVHDQTANYSDDTSRADTDSVPGTDYSMGAVLGLTTRKEAETSNMLPEESRRKLRRSSMRRHLVVSGILVIVSLTLLMTYFYFDLSAKRGHLEALQVQLDETSPLAAQLEQLRSKSMLLQQQADGGINVLDVLSAIHDAAPRTATVEYFEFFRKERSLVRGQAENLRDVLSFVGKLRESELFAEVKMDYANKIRYGDGTQVQYQITVEVK